MSRALWRGWVALGLVCCALFARGSSWAGADPTSWAQGSEAVLPANAHSPFSGVGLDSISCASVGNCSAVGSYVDGSNNRQGVLFDETGGVWGKGIEPTPPANGQPGLSGVPDAVSCPTAGNCTAVGTYTDQNSQGQGLVLTETNGVWGKGEEATLPADAIPISVVLSSVSCPSVGECTAVGEYDKTPGQQQVGLLLTETGGMWSTGEEAPLPANASTTGQQVQLSSVSCASAGECSVVGFYKDSNGVQQGLLLTLLGGSIWTATEATLPADDTLTNHRVFVTQVSCGAAGDCGAVGEDTDSSGHQVGLLFTQSSHNWAQAVTPILPNDASPGTSAVPQSVSCVAGGNCAAVGSYRQDPNGYTQGLLLTESGGTWEQGAEATLPANQSAGNPDVQLGSVSCVSAGNCSAVGDYLDNTNDPQGLNAQGLLLTESGGVWGPGVEAIPPPNAGPEPSAGVSFVSCAAADGCSAVGGYSDSGQNPWGLLLGGSGPRFALTVRRAGSGFGHVTGSGISCPSTCSKRYPAGTKVTLTATPFPGSTFAGWSGAGCTGKSTCSVTLQADRSVTATFTGPPQHVLAVVRGGTGAGTVTSSPVGISCGASCSASFDQGAQVKLIPTPASGSLFAGWSGGGCGQSRAEKPKAGGPGSACQVTMSSDHKVTANFVPKAEVKAVAGSLRAGLDRIKQAFHDPTAVGNAVCKGQVSYGVGAKEAGKFTAAPITVVSPATAGGHAAGRMIVVFAGATHRFRHAGRATIAQRLTRKGRQILRAAARQHHRLTLHVLLSFTFSDPVKIESGGKVPTRPPPPRC